VKSQRALGVVSKTKEERINSSPQLKSVLRRIGGQRIIDRSYVVESGHQGGKLGMEE